jgi:hypothetical protein
MRGNPGRCRPERCQLKPALSLFGHKRLVGVLDFDASRAGFATKCRLEFTLSPHAIKKFAEIRCLDEEKTGCFAVVAHVDSCVHDGKNVIQSKSQMKLKARCYSPFAKTQKTAFN